MPSQPKVYAPMSPERAEEIRGRLVRSPDHSGMAMLARELQAEADRLRGEVGRLTKALELAETDLAGAARFARGGHHRIQAALGRDG
jgi:hypothetical protein